MYGLVTNEDLWGKVLNLILYIMLVHVHVAMEQTKHLGTTAPRNEHHFPA